MSIAIGGHGKAQQGASTPTSPIAVTVALTAGNTGIVDVTYAGPTVGSVTSITGGGTWTQKQIQLNGIAKIERWTTGIGGVATASSISIAYTVNGSTAVQAICSDYSGVQSFGNSWTNLGATSNPSIALNTEDAGNVVVGGFGFADGTVATPVPTAGTGNLREADAVSAAGADDSAAALTDNTSATPGVVTNSVTFAASAGTKWAALALELRTISGPVSPPRSSRSMTPTQRLAA